MTDIVEEVLRIGESGGEACLATLIRSTGSVPMSRRAKLLVRADGSMAGTIGGGCLEAEVWRLARDVIHEGRPRCLQVTLDQADAAEEGLVCGGSVEILLEPVGGPDTAALYRDLAALLAGEGLGVLATVVEPDEWPCPLSDDPGGGAGPSPVSGLPSSRRGGSGRSPVSGLPSSHGRHLLVRADGSLHGSLGDLGVQAAVVADAPGVLRQGAPRLATYTSAGPRPDDVRTIRVFLEPVAPAPKLYLFGAGHVGLATARIAALIGMRVVVVDDRREFASPERFPEADQVLVAPFEQAFEQLAVGESSYVVVATRGHRHDEVVVAQALGTPARYVGMIGSRHKVAVTFGRLREKGVSEADLARVHAPIGLDIGADTPEEIAVSILAEIIALRRSAGAPPTHPSRARPEKP